MIEILQRTSFFDYVHLVHAVSAAEASQNVTRFDIEPSLTDLATATQRAVILYVLMCTERWDISLAGDDSSTIRRSAATYSCKRWLAIALQYICLVSEEQA